MFGYVRAPLAQLPEPEQQRFRQMYCGLCHTLRNRHGFWAQFILNYDFTFLAMLLSQGEQAPCLCKRCLSSPMKKRDYAPSTPALCLAADQSVILAYYQLQDHVSDSGFFQGLPYGIALKALKKSYKKAAKARPSFDQATRGQLALLHDLEVARCPSMDESADTFGQLLASASLEVDEPIQQRVLHQLLYHLGRWIYLIDAADDLEKDWKTGNYNPVALRYGLEQGQWTDQAKDEFTLSLDHSVQFIATALALRPASPWTPLLESCVYTGLFAVGKSVLDGTDYNKKQRKHIEIPKNVEEHP